MVWRCNCIFDRSIVLRRTGLPRPDAVNTTYRYDPLSPLLSVVHQKAGITLDGATYTVDAAGNRTSKGDLQAGVTSNYTYDAIYELTKATQGTSTTESYAYASGGQPAEFARGIELHSKQLQPAYDDLQWHLHLR